MRFYFATDSHLLYGPVSPFLKLTHTTVPSSTSPHYRNSDPHPVEIRTPSGLTICTDDSVADRAIDPCFVICISPGTRGQAGQRDTNRESRGDYWNVKRPSRIRLQPPNSLPHRKVLITVPRAWIETVLLDCSVQGAPVPEAFVQHRYHGTWQPSRHALALAEQLINPASDLPMLQTLAAESKATEITREVLRSILNTGPDGDPAPMTLEISRAKTVREFILAHQVEDLPLGVIAEKLGMSIGSMQAAFKATYRMTIGAFIREQRLLAARDAIEQDGKRVSEAAYLAGYDNPGSFSTAFRRQFGFPPSNCKR